MKRFIYYIAILFTIISQGCSDDYVNEVYDDEELTISRYLERDENYSELLNALKRTQYFNILSLQGAYTLLAPDNDAFKEFYAKEGISSLDQLDDAAIDRLVATHIIEEKIPSVNFVAGRMKYPNSGESLIMSFGIEGLKSAKINDIGISTFDMIRTNGVIHGIDAVITPADKTIGEILEEDPDYSILFEALNATGIIDSLNSRDENNKNRFTLLAESNAVYEEHGITSYEDLKSVYSTTDDVTNASDSLNRFMRYHILTEDITRLEFKTWPYNTLLNYPVNVNIEDGLKVNPITEEDESITYAGIDPDYIDKLGWNGIIHRLTSVLPVIDVKPEGVVHVGTDVCLSTTELDPTKVIYAGDAEQPWISSDQEVLQYLCTEVGDYVEFYSPYLFDVTYKVYYEPSTWEPGKTILGVYVNDELVGEPFVNEYSAINIANGQKGYYVGKVTLSEAGQQRIKVKVEGSYLYPEDNYIRLKKIYFEPDN